MPFIGPDPPRDLFGDAADLALDPFLYLPPAEPFFGRILTATTLRTASPFEEHARNIVLRRELEKGSVDPYFTMRDVYRQLRENEIGDGPPDFGDPN
jgi:phospholipid-binding lipoprotein MlaA